MKNWILILLLLFPLMANSKQQSLEELYVDVADQIGKKAWLGYQRKLAEIRDTYDWEIDDKGEEVEYYAQGHEGCPEGNLPRQVIYRMDYSEIPKEGEANVTHWACGQNKLYEVVRVTGGEKPYQLTGLRAFTGLRPYSSPKGYSYYEYEVSNFENETYFRITDQDFGDRRVYEFRIGQHVAFEMIWYKQDDNILMNGIGVDASWNLSEFGLNYIFYRYSDGQSGMYAYYDKHKHIKFLGANSQLPRSKGEFKGFMNYFPLRYAEEAIFLQLEALANIHLPKSSIDPAGSSDRLKDEVERMIIRLNSNDIQTVINELLELLEAIEQGKIKDER